MMLRSCVLILLGVLFTAGIAKADLYNYGAIAFNQDTLDFSFSINWGSRQQARAYVMQRCKNCTLVGEFWNNCGSLAIAQDGTYGWDGEVDKALSQRRALANCAQSGGAQCKIVVSACNEVPQPTTTVNPNSDSGRIVGRHGCWYRNGNRVIGCVD